MRYAIGTAALVLAACGGGGVGAVTVALPGTSWALAEIAGTPVVEPGRATLQFEESGRASGNGSCNRFSGTATMVGDSLSFGPLISTKMACVEEALTAQEGRYLGSLGAARRYAVSGDTLRIYTTAGEELRFIRAPR
jgi:heat shock protein HslJ